MRHKFQRLTGQLTFRLFVSHVAVAVLTGICLTGIFFVLIWHATSNPPLEVYQATAIGYGMMWLSGSPDGQPSDLDIDPMPGWTLIVSDDGHILWGRGDTTCRAGTLVIACPQLTLRGEERGLFVRDGKPSASIDFPLITGQRVIMERGQVTSEPSIVYGEVILTGYVNLFWFELVSRGIMAVPIAFLLAWLFMRPQVKRLKKITQASRRFAAGELIARARDSQDDEVGRLAQRNTELALQAEEAAIKAERARISRDLHDAIAQRLFSLSVSTTALPGIIAQNAERGVQQAKLIGEMAEQTLLDLRALLVEMRPTNISQHGLAESLKLLFRQWQSLHHIHIEPALMLTGRHIPAAVEDAVYQITQEALSNVARHARASMVELSLVEGKNKLVLSISDNGRGFDPDSQPQSAKFGLMSMRERAQMFGGTIGIESHQGGTTIEVFLPLVENL